MREPFLEVTFHRGRALAAYLYLPRDPEEKSARTKRVEPGLVIDFTADGKPIGIEITAPGQISLTVIYRVLEELGRSPVTQADLAPLLAA